MNTIAVNSDKIGMPPTVNASLHHAGLRDVKRFPVVLKWISICEEIHRALEDVHP